MAYRKSTYREGETPTRIKLWVTSKIIGTTHDGYCSDSGDLENYEEEDNGFYPLPDYRVKDIFNHLDVDGNPDLDYLNTTLGYTDGLGIRCCSGYGCGGSSSKVITHATLEFEYEEGPFLSKVGKTVKDFIDSKTPKVTIDIVPKRTHPTRNHQNLHTIRPICKYYREGRCSFGSKCRNRHN